MLVTLPFVLLLLDYWPLNRFAPLTLAPAVTGNGDSMKSHSVLWRLILEKIPLLVLTGAACVATMVAQRDIIISAPLALRIGNAAVSYVVYLRQMVCPVGLAVLYPYPEHRTSRVGNHAGSRAVGWHFLRVFFSGGKKSHIC